MNYKNVSAILVHDEYQVHNLTVITKDNCTRKIIGEFVTHEPWLIHGTISQEIVRIKNYLIGSGYRLNIIGETMNSIVYDINVININRLANVDRYIITKGGKEW